MYILSIFYLNLDKLIFRTMSFSLKDELFNLSSAAPKLKDPEDEYSDDGI